MRIGYWIIAATAVRSSRRTAFLSAVRNAVAAPRLSLSALCPATLVLRSGRALEWSSAMATISGMKRILASFSVLGVLLLPATPLFSQDYDPDSMGTFSIIARDAKTGELGMGVQSKAFG